MQHVVEEGVLFTPGTKERTKQFVKKEFEKRQNFVKSGRQFLDTFRTFIVDSVKDKSLTKEEGGAYFKEMLHVILFYGQINRPIINPEEILTEGEFVILSERFQGVFQKCKTHLPTRPPYTVLLDAIVAIRKTRDAKDILRCLLDLTNKMDVTNHMGEKCGNNLVSTVISCCYFRKSADNYFGASVSCAAWQHRQIMIDILCCKTWHKDIGWAVCVGNKYNLTAFIFPSGVHSMAFNIYSSAKAIIQERKIKLAEERLGDCLGTRSCEIAGALRENGKLVPKEPCNKCFRMFPDINFDPNPKEHNKANWEYGNCAECESLSQLLNSDDQIVRNLDRTTFPQSPEQLRNEKYDRLNQNLRKFEFRFEDTISYYNNQE
ncbi:uncharacterized protein LOC119953239 [Scyliorhinus canicula]|uniref:uncharacterized protein LOC119953239 n=1 Tax=Scyliorhinus canicula TaxID=7830 RepID=UPI0018F2D9A4|nr:uncharacterized protein LOC119953239 [Scyliorhinus canicula]